jgi:hypothetical protein
MRERAASAVSQNALTARNAPDEGRVDDSIDDALEIAGYPRHGLSARVQHCCCGGRTTFGSDHGRALPEAAL